MLAVASPFDRPLNIGSFIAVAILHLLVVQAVLSPAETAPALTSDPALYVQFIAAPEPEPLQPPVPPPPSPPQPVEKLQPKPLITTRAAEPAPQAIQAPPETVTPEPLPPVGAAPPSPPAPPAEPVTAAPRFDLDYLNNPAPDYPQVAHRLGQEGRVLLEVRVSAEGKVISLSIMQSSGFPRLDQSALNAVRRWTFKPSMRGDTAVEGRAIVPIDFDLNN